MLLEHLPVLSDRAAKSRLHQDAAFREKEIISIRNYICEGLLPLVYMYLKNIQATYFINSKRTNKSLLADYKKNVSKVFQVFSDNTIHLSIILDAKGDFGLNKDLVTKYNKNNEVERSAVYIESDYLNQQDKMGDSRRMEIDRNLQEMDIEEIINIELYQMRKKCENVIDTIEKLYHVEKRYILSNFVRFTSNKRDFNQYLSKDKSNQSIDYENNINVNEVDCSTRNGIKFKFYQKEKLLQNYGIHLHSKKIDENL